MPTRPMRVCSKPGCGKLTRAGRCDEHKRVGWADDSERGNRHERGYDSAWERRRDYILTRDNYLCQVCARAGRLTAAEEVDHIMPKAQGGTDDEGNLQAICVDCHRKKTSTERAAR